MHPSTVRALLWATLSLLNGRVLVAQMASAPGPDTGTAARQKRGSETSIFAPLTLPPAPSSTRLASGAPGPKYWQNRTDYNIQATLDTAAHTLRGSMTLRYTNHSPDTLKTFWFQTERRDEVIDQFAQIVHGHPVELVRQHPNGDLFELQVTPAAPLSPGQTTTFQVQWHFPRKVVGTVYEISLWYPRPNVYDDVKGWNTESLATGEEYYLEYGDFHVSITVPAGYIVAATGTLDNPQDVLTPTERARLSQAAVTDTVVRIVTAAELANGSARPTHDGTLTWKFHADHVRDAVWSTSPAYQWDATHWHHTLVQAYYEPAAAAAWEDGADQARTSIQEYSERWYPYPYPQVSVVEGPDFGMEYPMLAMIGAIETKPRLYTVLTHEVGHNWFPMLVGSNERVYPWMDEGFNTFINTFSEARRYPKGGDQASRIAQGMSVTPPIMQQEKPIIRDVYDGTAYILQLLRRDVLDSVTFDKAFRTYITRWAYKHPTPVDFFRTMADVSGRNLDWFWREGFLEGACFDQAIDSVRQTVQGNETHVTVSYGNHGRAVFPLFVRFTFSDGTTQDVTHPVDIWRAHPTQYIASYTFAKKTVRRITLDPQHHLPDADSTNNVWTAP